MTTGEKETENNGVRNLFHDYRFDLKTNVNPYSMPAAKIFIPAKLVKFFVALALTQYPCTYAFKIFTHFRRIHRLHVS